MPSMCRTSNIGEGATFLNRVLSNKMFKHDATGAGLLAEFLASLNYKGNRTEVMWCFAPLSRSSAVRLPLSRLAGVNLLVPEQTT